MKCIMFIGLLVNYMILRGCSMLSFVYSCNGSVSLMIRVMCVEGSDVAVYRLKIR